jgi:hypothetical protein
MEGEQERGRKRGPKSTGNGNMEESMSSVPYLLVEPKEIWHCVFPVPPIPIVLGCSFPCTFVSVERRGNLYIGLNDGAKRMSLGRGT